MKFEEIRQIVKGVPYVMADMAYDLYHHVLENKPEQCLELGFAHGASSCYIAAALDEVGIGHLTSVDLVGAGEWQEPTIEQLLKKTGLTKWVTAVRECTSYNWFLKKMIAARSEKGRCLPLYDFCFIDGAKNWTIDGAAFFFTDKLLRQNAWIVFDDLQWTYKSKLQEGKKKTDGVSMLEMGEDELCEPHIELIFQLLVMQHPDYSNFLVKDNWWGWAQKSRSGKSEVEIKLSTQYKARLAAWEEKHQKRQRPPFAPYE